MFYWKALLVSALLGSALGAAAQAPAARTFTNPLRADGPDPWVIRRGEYYYYTNTTGRNLTLWKSKTLEGVQTAPAAVAWTPPAAGPNSTQIWAPELHYF
ncbi:MAG: glycosyl hydrolase family 43, partial [Hymenobacter sp.]